VALLLALLPGGAARADASVDGAVAPRCAAVVAPQPALNLELQSPKSGAWAADEKSLAIFYTPPDGYRPALEVSQRTRLVVGGATLWLLIADHPNSNDWTFLLTREIDGGLCVVNAYGWQDAFGPEEWVDATWTAPDGKLALALVHHYGRTRSGHDVTGWTNWAVLATDGRKLWLAWDESRLSERERLAWNRDDEASEQDARLDVRARPELELRAGRFRRRYRLGADGRFAPR
jgi:hypothetical protein